MADLQLRTVTRRQGNNAALLAGEVQPRTCDLVFEDVPVLVHAFRHMVRELAYDVCEMALTTYLTAREHGVPLTALPVFLVRGLHHDKILKNVTAGVERPKDLEGRRVGVNRGYTVTTGVWARAILAEEHDVDLTRVTWVLSGDEHVATYEPPANVVAAAPGADLAALLAAGELPAAAGITVEHPDVVPLIPDPEAAAYVALRDRGLYPINHLVVVRDDVLAAHPEVAVDLFEAFAASKQQYVDALRAGELDAPDDTDRMHQRVMEITGGDPLPYGIEPNREVLERLIRAAVEQGILRRPVAVDDVFAPTTRDLTA
ncbi:MAG: ABC transporter substrate-binding protein [Actinobacteria bacterium]|nr:ABC transporter substrate-binding protein [Actinomycetota bacterium]